MQMINIKDRLHEADVLALIAHSQYRPTPEGLRALARRYRADGDIHAFAGVEEGAPRGAIILQRLDGDAFEIISIATDPAHRGRGVGARLIAFAMEALPCGMLTAETDDDAVEFYRKCGFAIASLGEKYPGVVRYRCTLRRA